MALKRIKNLDVWSDLFPHGDKIDNTNQILHWSNSVYKVKFPQHHEKTASRLFMLVFQLCALHLAVLSSSPFWAMFMTASPIFFFSCFPPSADRSQQFTPRPCQSIPRELTPKTHGWLTVISIYAGCRRANSSLVCCWYNPTRFCILL